MHRRQLLSSGIALAAMPMIPRLAWAAGGPISFWYESASPENQEALQKILIEPFNAAHP